MATGGVPRGLEAGLGGKGGAIPSSPGGGPTKIGTFIACTTTAPPVGAAAAVTAAVTAVAAAAAAAALPTISPICVVALAATAVEAPAVVDGVRGWPFHVQSPEGGASAVPSRPLWPGSLSPPRSLFLPLLWFV